ncbi:MAG: Ig-like domain-containing protein [bacterium]|nr:Ig-like domain-containing protein [candidate division KSB1 bacterium]MDH7559121.1 Ig-like domain-containing protein [bacterium]
MRNRRLRGLCLVALLVVGGCARQGFPPGGPEDKTPPEVVATWPAGNAVQVPPSVRVSLTFSEKMQRQSVEQALFVVPKPAGTTSLRWRGRTLFISFSEALRLGRTYVVTVGTDARDLRNNRVSQAFSLAFSTGRTLDSCAVSGRVFGTGQLAGTAIWAFDLSAEACPDPSRTVPDYVTQCGATGEYLLRSMAPGAYRLFAVLDRDGNQRYDAEYDALGVPAGDVELSAEAPLFRGCDFRLAVRDTTPPRLESATASDARHVHVRFSEPMQSWPLTVPDNYLILSQDGGDSLRVMAAYVDTERPSFVHLATSLQRPASYRLTVRRACDANDLCLHEATIEFAGSGLADTVRPALVKSVPKDSARVVPCTLTLAFTFSEAMDTASVRTALTFTDSAGVLIPGRLQWPSAAQCEFVPQRPLAGRCRHRATLLGSLARDLSGLPLRLDTVRVTFWTMNCDTLSSIAGTVRDEDPTATGPVVIRASQVRPKGASHEVMLPEPGPYEIADLLPGVYLLEAYRDEDANGRYSLGSALPFRPAERFVVLADSVQVRSRWPNVGNDIVLPRWGAPRTSQLER